MFHMLLCLVDLGYVKISWRTKDLSAGCLKVAQEKPLPNHKAGLFVLLADGKLKPTEPGLGLEFPHTCLEKRIQAIVVPGNQCDPVSSVTPTSLLGPVIVEMEFGRLLDLGA